MPAAGQDEESKAAQPVSLSVGTHVQHSLKGLGKITEIGAEGNWTVWFEKSGATHTYKPGSQQKLKVQGGTSCSIARMRLSVGTRLKHETKGLCTLIEVRFDGSWSVRLDVSGTVHTYKPSSQHKLKVDRGPVAPADVTISEDDSYCPGERVVHSKHGLGVVMHRLPDDRLNVAFDDGQYHLYKAASVALKLTRAPVDAPAPPPQRGRFGLQGVIFELDLNETVRDVFARHGAAILDNDVLGQHEKLSVMQGGVDVLSDSWSSLQYNYDERRKLAVVSLVAEGEGGADRATLTFQTSHANRICSALLHGGAGAVGNYRAEHDSSLDWLLGEPEGEKRPVAFREFYVQSSHNTFILGQQLKLALRGNPIDIVYTEAFPIALNLGYRCLELDVYRAHEKAGGELLVRHGPIGAPSNSVALHEVLAATADWMVRDERGAAAWLRLPLVLSVENNLAGEAAELEMAASFDSFFGERLVRPAAFHDPSMRELASTQRRVILKSGSYRGKALGAVKWAELVAMWKPPMHPLDSDATVCKSIEAPSASALATPSRIIAQSSLYLVTTAKKSAKTARGSVLVLERRLSHGLMELPHNLDVAAAKTSTLIQARVRGHSARALPVPVVPKPVEVPTVPSGVGSSLAVQTIARELMAVVSIQARYRGRVAREDARLVALESTSVQSGRDDVALTLKLQMRVINGRRKTTEQRAHARLAIDPTLRVDSVLCKVTRTLTRTPTRTLTLTRTPTRTPTLALTPALTLALTLTLTLTACSARSTRPRPTSSRRTSTRWAASTRAPTSSA